MDNEDYSMMSLAEFIKMEMEKNYTVEEAIKEKQSEIDVIKEGFKVIWDNYKSVSDIRKDSIKNLTSAKYKLLLSNLLIILLRSDAKIEIDKLINLIEKNTKELKDEKELLILIRDTIKRLELILANNCNYELCDLLSNLYDKNMCIYNDVLESIKASAIRLRGISTQTPEKYKVQKEELDKKIDVNLLKLGLKK